MRLREWTRWILLGLVAVTACGGGAEEVGMAERDTLDAQDPAEALRQARADSVTRAESLYDEAAFDSIAWRSDAERLERGRDVWNFSCGDCHGWQGQGDGPVAARHGYDVPDFTAPGWDVGNVDSLRHRVFVGHESEMPSWGLYGLTYRDIDAVTYYIDREYAQR